MLSQAFLLYSIDLLIFCSWSKKRKRWYLLASVAQVNKPCAQNSHWCANAGFARNPSGKNVNRPLRSGHQGHQEEFFPSAGKMRQAKGFTPDGEVSLASPVS